MYSDFGHWVISSLTREKPEWILPGLFGGNLATQISDDPERLAIFLKFFDTTFPFNLRKAGAINDSEQFAALPVYPLEKIQSPTLILHGTADTLVPFEGAELAVRTIPNAELVKFENGGHWFFIAHMGEFLSRVVEFLKAHAPEGNYSVM